MYTVDQIRCNCCGWPLTIRKTNILRLTGIHHAAVTVGIAVRIRLTGTIILKTCTALTNKSILAEYRCIVTLFTAAHGFPAKPLLTGKRYFANV